MDISTEPVYVLVMVIVPLSTTIVNKEPSPGVPCIAE